MLVRCEKCGKVFPKEIGKCLNCYEPVREKSPEEIEKEARRRAEEKNAEWKPYKKKKMRVAVVYLIIAVALFIFGFGMAKDEYNSSTGSAMLIIGLLFFIVSITVFVIMVYKVPSFDDDVESFKTGIKSGVVSPEEYDQLIRDALNDLNC